MSADRPNIGTGRRRQGDTEPRTSDDRNRALDRAVEQDTGMAATDAPFEQGRQPGAHGATVPHRNVKPGTRLDLEQAGGDTRQE